MTLKGGEPAVALGAFLSRGLELSEPQARRLVERGAVYLKGKRCRQWSTLLNPGDVVTAVLQEGGRSTVEPLEDEAPFALCVLFEDAEVFAVNKPPGVPSQPTPGGTGVSLLERASRHLGAPAGLVHRLDLETSGVMIFGKSPGATSSLAACFREGTARKRYLAVVGPGLNPRSGSVDLAISKDPSRPGRYRAKAGAQGVSAFTEFHTLAAPGAFTLLALFPRTGRTHQLRAHLTALEHPIAGDRKYGGAEALGGNPADRCLLHAQALLISQPRTMAPLLLEAPLPPDLQLFFDAAEASPPKGAW